MRLYKTADGPVVEHAGVHHAVAERDWDTLINSEDLTARLEADVATGRVVPAPVPLAPIGGQEVWAAGVTYFRSRDARMGESQAAGGGTFYDRVYEAERPELFFKASPHRVVGPGGRLRLRRDARWIVPEPELVLVVNRRAQIVGYTVGDDLSCRDIEGENPLYLPQAKTYDGCAALGPAVLVSPHPLPSTTEIAMEIERAGALIFAGATTLAQLRRSPALLVEFLFREASFPSGCLLFTGTGVIPPDDFSLRDGDRIVITIPPIGTLETSVAQGA